jgi:hypothetical protein
MTYPAGAGTFTGNYGPSTSNAGTVGQAPPFTAPGAAVNVADQTPTSDTAAYNFTHSITSTQEDINNTVASAPQQGPAYITNTSSVILAGVAPSGFTYFTGITKG